MTAVTTTAIANEEPGVDGVRPLVPRGLITLNQIADAQCIRFSMAVTCDRIRSSRRLNQNVRPENSGCDLHRSNLANRNTFLVAAEPAFLHAAHAQRADHDARRKPEISPGPPARAVSFLGTSRIRTRLILTG